MISSKRATRRWNALVRALDEREQRSNMVRHYGATMSAFERKHHERVIRRLDRKIDRLEGKK